ncbi:hypothetical protein KCV06_g2, partial [Aureobasidium melanogenum]
MRNHLSVLTLVAAATGVQAYQQQLDVPDSAFTSWQLPTAVSGPCDSSSPTRLHASIRTLVNSLSTTFPSLYLG